MFDRFIESTLLMFVAIDPISLVPIFAGLTSGVSQHQVKSIYIRASIVSLIVLSIFWLFGNAILVAMNISMDSFRIIGGLFLIVIAFQMVFDQRQKRREETIEEAMDDEELSSLATFPLAIPLIAGPGAITLAMLLSEKSGVSIESQLIGFSPILIVLVLTAFSMWASGTIAKKLPISVLGALQRTFGLLLGALAIEFVIEGLRQTFNI